MANQTITELFATNPVTALPDGAVFEVEGSFFGAPLASGAIAYSVLRDLIIASLDASHLSAGTIPDARFPAVLPAVSGTALTHLNAGALENALPAIDAAALTGYKASSLSPATGPVPDNCFPSTLPAVNGSALTGLTAANLTGPLPAIDGSALVGVAKPADITLSAILLAAGVTPYNFVQFLSLFGISPIPNTSVSPPATVATQSGIVVNLT